MKNLLPLLVVTLLAFTANSQTNYAINLNGSNQWASIGAPIPNNSSYTKEAWINVGSVGGSQNIISSSGAPLWLNGSVLSAGHGGNYTQVTDIAPFVAGKWTHVAVTYDAATTTMKLYRDGILVSTNTGVAANYNNETVFLASHSSGSSLINGLMDEVRIWTVALTAAQLKQYMHSGPPVSASGLAAYYKCNDGSGAVLTNATGGVNGTLQNAPLWLASAVAGPGNAITFDGVDDHIVIPHMVSSDFTVECWIKTTMTGTSGSQWFAGSGIVDAEMPGETNDWGLTLNGNRISFGIGQPDRTIFSLSTVNTGAWVHVAASWQQSTGEMKLYINGVLEATSNGSLSVRSAPTRIVMGRKQNNEDPLNGSLDEVRIWNEVRTPVQLLAYMNRELAAATQPTLLAYYNFNQGVSNGSNAGLTTLIDVKGNNNGVLTNFSLSGTASNFTTQNVSMLTLPLQWLNFTAQKQNNAVLLKWSTAQEENTKDFIVQHSANATNWTNIAVLPAAGTYAAVSDYSCVHTSPASVNYYRILQTDMDGRSSYSDVRVLAFTNSLPLFALRNNPVSDGIAVVTVNKPTTLSLYNLAGKLLWKQHLKEGSHSIDLSRYAKGMYVLSGGGEGKSFLIQ
mgnify:CR=1 FL=1